MIMQHGNQSHQWKNQLGMNCTKQNIEGDEVKATSDIRLNSMNTTKEDSPQEEAAYHQAYKLLRRIPGYSIGDPLRQADMIICDSKEATAFAMNKLRPNDCAFILRSDGSFTYSLYEGQANGHSSAISFQVDDRGSFKILPLKQFLTWVKVPVLPVALMGNAALVARYITEDDDEKEEEGEKEDHDEKEEVDPTERQGAAKVQASVFSRSASMGQFNRRLTTGSTQHAPSPVLQEPKSNIMSDMLAKSAPKHPKGLPLQKVPSRLPSLILQNLKSKILSDMLAKSAEKHPKAGQTAINQDNINTMSRMKMATATTGANIRASVGQLNRRRLTTVSRDFRQTMNTVPESSKLGVPAPNQAFMPTKKNTSAPPNMIAVRPMNRWANTVMSRNVTLRRLGTRGNDAAANSGKSSWEVANGNNRTINEIPLPGVATKLSLTSLAEVPTHKHDASHNMPEFKYSIGDQLRKDDVPRVDIDMEEVKMALMVSKLKVNDTAFVRRSDRLYSYAMVTKKNLQSITFVVTANGNTKTFDFLSAGRYVRFIKEEEKEYVKRMFGVPRARAKTKLGEEKMSQQTNETLENESNNHPKEDVQQGKIQASLVVRRPSDPPTSQVPACRRSRRSNETPENEIGKHPKEDGQQDFSS